MNYRWEYDRVRLRWAVRVKTVHWFFLPSFYFSTFRFTTRAHRSHFHFSLRFFPIFLSFFPFFSLFFSSFFLFLQGGRTVDREQKYSFHGLLVVWKIAGLRLRNCARNFGICGRLKLKILRLWNIRKLEVSAIFTKLYLPTQIL